MFMTSPQFEQAMPRALVPAGQRCWRAMELSFNHHWYFVTIRERDAGIAIRRSLILGMDHDLIGMLRSDPPFDFVSIELALPPSAPRSRWTFEEIRTVWTVEDERSPHSDLLLFRTKKGKMIEPFMNLDASELGMRRLELELT